METGPFVTVGRVVKAHGLKGEVSVAPAEGLPFVLSEGLEVWFVPPPASVRNARVESVRPGPKGPLVKFSGVDSPDVAHELGGATITARRSELPQDLEEEWDPVGLRVRDGEHGDLGEVVDVIYTGANDVWVVEGPLGQVLLPVIDEVVLDVDEATRTARVHLLPGLL